MMEYGIPERVEQVLVHAQFDATKMDKKDISRIEKLFNVQVPEDGKVTVDYPFRLLYFNIVGQFSVFLDMLDKAAVVKVNTEELRFNMCLLQELLCKLEKIEKKYAG